MQLKFPQGFLWGAATSAHQVEGGNTNSDWWRWEHSPERISALKKQNKNPLDYSSGIGCDSYNRYEEDFDIAKSLNHNVHRLSIEWARIEPFQGEFDEQQIEHYRQVLLALRARGIKSFVTLHHFTNPIWFSEVGGWSEEGNILLFIRYAEKVLTELSDLIDYVCIINEPNVLAAVSYLVGAWPPQRKNIFLANEVEKNLYQAHVKVYQFCKKNKFSFPVGVAHHFKVVETRGLLKIVDRFLKNRFYRNYLKKISRHTDFFGVQYYSRLVLRLGLEYPFYRIEHEKPLTDFSWEIYPEGLYQVLKDISLFNKPIYITENGVADREDLNRKKFIHDHLVQLHKAVSEGADVRGYMHWALLDNFEWAEGYEMKFGLVSVDRKNNLERTVRESAKYYAEVCKNNYLEVKE